MAGKPIDDLAVIISASTEQLAGDLARAAGMFKTFAKTVESQSPKSLGKPDQFVGPPPTYVPGLRLARDATLGLAAANRSVAASMASMARQTVATAAGIAMYEAGVSGLSGVIGTVKESVKLAADMEQNQLSFEVMLGSAERAVKMMGEIRRFAATTPFNTQEITAAARGLLAYGVAADQVMPTVRMLGDVAATYGKDLPISRLTYLYGTLFAQQRAYTVDIKQFAMAGIPIWEELSKVTGKSVDDLHKMIEEGRIGRDEVTKAFIAMTSAGGKFENMTKRQADTVAGVIEAAGDAWQLAKTKFGQVVIEETGLKDSMRDFDAFAKRIETAISAPNSPVRQAVRFMGDLTKTVIQTGYEIGRASAKFAELKWGDLRLPDVNSKEWGLAIAEGIIVPLADVYDWLGKIGGAFEENLARPLRDLRDFARDNWVVNSWAWGRDTARSGIGALGDARNAVGDWILTDEEKWWKGWHAGGWKDAGMRDLIVGDNSQLGKHRAYFHSRPVIEEAIKGDRYGPPQAGESKEQIAERYRELDLLIGLANDFVKSKGFVNFQSQLDELLKRRLESFIIPFGVTTDADFARLHEQFWKGTAPDFAPGFEAGRAPNRKLSAGEAAREAFRQMRAEDALKAQGAGFFHDLPARMLAEQAERLKAFQLAQSGFGAAPFPGRAAFTPIPPEFYAGVRAAPFPFGGAFSGGPGNGVKLMGDVPLHLVELSNRIRDEFNPLDKILREQQDLAAAVGFGKLTQGQANWAHDRSVRELAERMGIGGQVRLPDAAMRDTTESNRILNQWAAGMEPMTTKQLLEQIRDAIDRQTKKMEQGQREMNEAIPVIEPLPP